MTRTPWGDSERLRARKLNPRTGLSREAVLENQRERLFGAMVASVGRQGYDATTLADLVALSGVSRKTFYEHFVDKQACFVATVEAILESAIGMVSPRVDGRGGALNALVELIVDQPAAARTCLVETYAAGPAAIKLVDRALAGLETAWQSVEPPASGTNMPPQLAQAIIGGVRKVMYTRLRRGKEAELTALAPELWKWMIDYKAPPLALRRRRSSGSGAVRHNPDDPAERIMAAAKEVIAEQGYPSARIADIVRRASVSPSTFYAHFEGKSDVFTAIVEAGQAQMFAAALPAYRRAKEWPAAIRASFDAMFGFLAADPAFAQVAMIESYTAGPKALERRDRTIEATQIFLEPGYERSPKTNAIALEATAGAVYALLSDHLRTASAESLPEVAPLATYITLAPFLGAKEACAVANGDRGGRRRPQS